LAEVEPGSRGSTSQLTLSRSPRRGGAAASWDKFENLSGPRWVDGIRRDRNALLEVDATMGRGHFALTPTLSHSHAGFAHRSSFCGRGGTRAAKPRASHRSDSPTPARRVGSGGSRTWSTAPSAVFPCGRRRRGMVQPGSRTARRSPTRFPPRFEPHVTARGTVGVNSALPQRDASHRPGRREHLSSLNHPDFTFVSEPLSRSEQLVELLGSSVVVVASHKNVAVMCTFVPKIVVDQFGAYPPILIISKSGIVSPKDRVERLRGDQHETTVSGKSPESLGWQPYLPMTSFRELKCVWWQGDWFAVSLSPSEAFARHVDFNLT
jgi:hypothetical protein